MEEEEIQKHHENCLDSSLPLTTSFYMTLIQLLSLLYTIFSSVKCELIKHKSEGHSEKQMKLYLDDRKQRNRLRGNGKRICGGGKEGR